jgi:uncharacterized protein
MSRVIAFFTASMLLLCSVTAHAALPARPQGPVYDGASIIPDDVEAGIDAKLRALSKETGKTLVVATVPSLDGAEVEEYAVKLFETWGIGDKELDEGALILVAPNERRTRIEVGLGSEGILPDALAGRIIDQQMLPRFKQGDFGGGIALGADAVSEQLRREPTEAKAVAAAAERAKQQERQSSDGGDAVGTVIFWLIIFFFFVLPIIRSVMGGGKKYRGKKRRDDDDDDDDWGGPVIIWGGSGFGGGGGSSSWGGGGFGGGGGGGFGGFGGGMSGGGGASGGW